MKQAAGQVDALSLHYYTVAGGWPPSRPSFGFGEDGWAEVLAATWRMDRLLKDHTAIMDRYDPARRVWLAVDEWGTWYKADPGTNPGFLQQHNTLRDALVAAVNLNIFTRYADRVKMTAIAQMVNVLQAMVLTDGPRMVRTPTFHVFEMFVPWQDATVLPLALDTPYYTFKQSTMPAVSASAVRGKDGQVHVALANLDPGKSMTLALRLDGLTPHRVSGRVLTGASVDAGNSFATPDAVAPVPFTAAHIADGVVTLTLPAKSVVVLALE